MVLPPVLTGVDIVDLMRFGRALERHPRMRQRVFTEGELDRCAGRRNETACLAVRFAAKEAVGKLLGTGVLTWTEAEIVAGEPPEVRLSGRTADVAHRLGVAGRISVSLSHSATAAVAVAVAQREE